MQIKTFSIHGSRAVDQRLMVNGLTSRNLLASAWASNFVPDMGTAAEIALDYSSGGGRSDWRRAQYQPDPEGRRQPFSRVVLRRGREQFVPGQQLHRRTEGRQGLSSPNELKRVYDVNPAVGGPIVQDKLWFFASVRWQESSYYPAGAFANKNGGDLTKWTYEPDPSKPARAS